MKERLPPHPLNGYIDTAYNFVNIKNLRIP
jgi:hypothetical protein